MSRKSLRVKWETGAISLYQIFWLIANPGAKTAQLHFFDIEEKLLMLRSGWSYLQMLTHQYFIDYRVLHMKQLDCTFLMLRKKSLHWAKGWTTRYRILSISRLFNKFSGVATPVVQQKNPTKIFSNTPLI